MFYFFYSKILSRKEIGFTKTNVAFDAPQISNPKEPRFPQITVENESKIRFDYTGRSTQPPGPACNEN